MYKTILVHVDDSASTPQRIDLAAQLALTFDAHLVGSAMTGLPLYLFPTGGVDPNFAAVPMLLEDFRTQANVALDGFENRVRQAGVRSFERRRTDEEPGWGTSMQARYCDLVVLGQTRPGQLAPRLRTDFPEYVLLNSPRPVLVVPAEGMKGGIGKRITVAWNGNADAVRAVTSALPMLQRAEHVDVVMFDADKEGGVHGQDPGADIGLYLARHGVRLQITLEQADGDAGQALLAHAAEQQADMIVMGAYGHSRLREILLGGATRTALRESTLPLWMAH